MTRSISYEFATDIINYFFDFNKISVADQKKKVKKITERKYNILQRK